MLRKLIHGGAALAIAATAVALMSVQSSSEADAAVQGVSLSATTISAGVTNFAVLTIDADEVAADADTLVDLQVVTTAGTLSGTNAAGSAIVALTAVDASCAGDSDCTTATGDGTNNVSFPDNSADNLDTVRLSVIAPATGPASAVITVVQGTSAKTATLNIRGNADTVELSILDGTAPSANPSSCTGASTNVLNAFNVASGQENAYACTLVKDSQGNRLPSIPVVYTGSIAGLLDSASGATSATGGADDTVTIDADGSSSATAGSEYVLTASGGGKSATDTIKLGGAPSSCVITTDPGTVDVGGSATVNIEVLDSTGGPSPDGITGTLVQTNPGSGANAAILDGTPTTNNGVAKDTLIAAIPGSVALGATFGSATCTGSVIATGATAPPTNGTPGTPSASVLPTPGGSGVLSVVSGANSFNDAFGALGLTVANGGTVTLTNSTTSNNCLNGPGLPTFVQTQANACMAGGFNGALAAFAVIP